MKTDVQQSKELLDIILPLDDDFDGDPETCFLQFVTNIESDKCK